MTQNLISEIVDLGSENPAEVALVIDVSGSMEGNKLLLTKAAAAKFIKLMRVKKDSLGVCSFSSYGNTVWAEGEKVKLLDSGATQGTAIGAVHNLTAGGGTDVLRGLELAAKMFSSFEAAHKAVILLSDGQDSNTTEEKRLSAQLNAARKNVYTIAIGADADHATLKALAGDDGRYNSVADAFTMNEVFNKIIGQIGIAHVLLNTVETIPADQFMGQVYPDAQADNTVPAGKSEVVVAVAWDKLEQKFAGVNTLMLLKANQLSFAIGKVESGSLVPPAKDELMVLHQEDGVLIVKISNAAPGDTYGVEIEQHYGTTDVVRFSVGVFA